MDAFGGGEAFPFRGRFGLWEGFGAWEVGRRRGELGEGAIWGGLCGEGVEGGEESLDAVACGGCEVFFEVSAVCTR